MNAGLRARACLIWRFIREDIWAKSRLSVNSRIATHVLLITVNLSYIECAFIRMSRPLSANGVVVTKPLRLEIDSKDTLFRIQAFTRIGANGRVVTRSSLRIPTISCISCAFIRMSCPSIANGPDVSLPSRLRIASRDTLCPTPERNRLSANGPDVRPSSTWTQSSPDIRQYTMGSRDLSAIGPNVIWSIG
jgi:hypothetical protein